VSHPQNRLLASLPRAVFGTIKPHLTKQEARRMAAHKFNRKAPIRLTHDSGASQKMDSSFFAARRCMPIAIFILVTA
jgi:hypothetical protein